MRESIGATWILELVIAFILLFVSFLCVALDYSKSLKIRNETISIIEKYEGMHRTSSTLIRNYMDSSGYISSGTCEPGWYGVNNKGIDEPDRVNGKYLMCFQKQKVDGTNRVYYSIQLFYNFKLPIFSDIATFRINGTTHDFENIGIGI